MRDISASIVPDMFNKPRDFRPNDDRENLYFYWDDKINMFANIENMPLNSTSRLREISSLK